METTFSLYIDALQHTPTEELDIDKHTARQHMPVKQPVNQICLPVNIVLFITYNALRYTDRYLFLI
jgi:hypothetical protein